VEYVIELQSVQHQYNQSYSTFSLNTTVHLLHKTPKCFGYRAQPPSSCLEELCGLRYQKLTDVI